MLGSQIFGKLCVIFVSRQSVFWFFLSIHAINYTAHRFAKNVLVLLDFKYVSITITDFQDIYILHLCMVARYDNISPVVWSFISYPEYYDM